MRAIWEAAERAIESGDADTLERLLREHSQVLRHERPQTSWLGGLSPDFSAADAKSIIAANNDFENWDQFAVFDEARQQPGSAVAPFEEAVDAIATGDIATLERLLRERPELIRARSMRRHHATLLHYVGANGVEGFRQRTPKNAVEVAKILLDAGAEVDAVADMYGGATTVGLVATSCHPRDAGVQNPLIDILIAHGAQVDRQGAGGAGGGESYPLINGCLANGRPGAAEYLASRGARIDLEGAAGIGRLDLVRGHFAADGRLTNGATPSQMHDGFSWACEYGRAEVVQFLLEHGMDVGARLRPHKQTGLHWAAFGAHVETVEVLLQHRPPLDVKDASFDGTPLGWTIYGWSQQPENADRGRYYDVVALLVAAGAPVDPQWLASNDRGVPLVDWMKGDQRMQDALAGRWPPRA